MGEGEISQQLDTVVNPKSKLTTPTANPTQRRLSRRSNGLLSPACGPYRPAANLRNIFRKIMAGAFFTQRLAATHPPRKNLALPHEKMVAFSLPQDPQVQLMFGAARFGEPALSASRSLEFHIAPRGGHSQHCLDNPRKCFNQRRILDAARRLAAPCDLNTCGGALFHKQRCAQGRSLPLVCRKAPEVCRKTWQLKSIRRTMQLKSFNLHPIRLPTKSGFAPKGATLS